MQGEREGGEGTWQENEDFPEQLASLLIRVSQFRKFYSPESLLSRKDFHETAAALSISRQQKEPRVRHSPIPADENGTIRRTICRFRGNLHRVCGSKPCERILAIFFKLEFPYAHFGTENVTTDLLFLIIWKGIRQLEGMGLKVICVTADGSSPNCKFFQMLAGVGDASPTFKTHNPFAKEER